MSYVVAVHDLLHVLQPSVPLRDIRHPGDRTKLSTHVMSYVNADGHPSIQRRGVVHLVHCWPAQGHPSGVLSYRP